MTETASRNSAGAITEAAADLLAALGAGQREQLQFRLDEETRTDWGYFPRAFHGLPLGALDAKQQKLAHRLVSEALSLHAYAKVTTIVALDNVLDVIEGRSRPGVRDPGRYFVRVFGDPRSPPWAWQFEGHHVSLNFTLGADGLVSPTPLFLGSNPAEISHAGRPVLRVCGEEEDAARDLVRSLGAFERSRAVLSVNAPPDIVLANAPRVPEERTPGEGASPLPAAQAAFAEYGEGDKQRLRFVRDQPAGLRASEMTPAQRPRFDALLDVYLGRLPEDIARVERAKLDAAGGAATLYFAWAGGDEPGQGHYYRIHGPTLLVEYDNTQDGANHIHAVLRDPRSDFGADILGDHLAAHR